jgi:glycerol-3-phosphate dehydrogenase
LLDLANAYLERPLAKSDIVWTYSGVRPLYDDGSADPSAVTRDYVLKVDALEGPPGPERAPVLSIFGGKVTTYRKLAEHALAELAPFFPQMKPAWTRNAPLPGGDLPGRDRQAWLAELCRRYPQLPVPLLRALADRHGTRALRILGDAQTQADLGEDFGAQLTAREIDYLLAEEWATTADDVLWRRTKCGLPMTQAQRDSVAEYMAPRV